MSTEYTQRRMNPYDLLRFVCSFWPKSHLIGGKTDSEILHSTLKKTHSCTSVHIWINCAYLYSIITTTTITVPLLYLQSKMYFEYTPNNNYFFILSLQSYFPSRFLTSVSSLKYNLFKKYKHLVVTLMKVGTIKDTQRHGN